LLVFAVAVALSAGTPAAGGASACSKCADSGGASVGACGQCFIEALFDALGGW
jgi:hypothetical protein